MYVTKQQILDAIKSENLIGGHGPINSRYDLFNRIEIYDNKCSVCAVGAVLRHTGVANGTQINYVFSAVTKGADADDLASVGQALKDKNWMAALSIKFEQLCLENITMATLRKRIANFVKRNFPSRVKLHGVSL